jgi:hypothetical protein
MVTNWRSMRQVFAVADSSSTVRRVNGAARAASSGCRSEYWLIVMCTTWEARVAFEHKHALLFDGYGWRRMAFEHPAAA